MINRPKQEYTWYKASIMKDQIQSFTYFHVMLWIGG